MNIDINDKEFIFVSEAAKLLNISQETVKYWERQGKLKAHRIGSRGIRIFAKIDVLDLAESIKRKKTK